MKSADGLGSAARCTTTSQLHAPGTRSQLASAHSHAKHPGWYIDLGFRESTQLRRR